MGGREGVMAAVEATRTSFQARAAEWVSTGVDMGQGTADEARTTSRVAVCWFVACCLWHVVCV